MQLDKSMTENDNSNIRIISILSVVFCFIPIVGLVLGVIATQKGHSKKSNFAITMGYIGIVLSLLVAVAFAYTIDKARSDAEDRANATLKRACIDDANNGAPDPANKDMYSVYYNPGSTYDQKIAKCNAL